VGRCPTAPRPPPRVGQREGARGGATGRDEFLEGPAAGVGSSPPPQE
jgi:hypothetical protein